MTLLLHQRVVPAFGDRAYPAGCFLPACPRQARSLDARSATPQFTQLVGPCPRRHGTISLQAVPRQTAVQSSPGAKPDPFSAPAMLFVGFSAQEVAVLEECFADDTTLGELLQPSPPPAAA